MSTFTLKIIPYGNESPMQSHLYGEIAADTDRNEFWVHQSLVVMNGMDSIMKACHSYPGCEAINYNGDWY